MSASNRFILRPVLTTVCSLLIVIAGLIALPILPIENLPDIAPPTVQVSARYQGADAVSVEEGLTAVLEFGDQETPYRYLPTFAAGTTVSNGASAAEVDAARTSVRVAENSPDARQRYAGSALVAHRFDNATVRVEERLYMDSWWLMATTTDFTLPVDVGLWHNILCHLTSVLLSRAATSLTNLDYMTRL